MGARKNAREGEEINGRKKKRARGRGNKWAQEKTRTPIHFLAPATQAKPDNDLSTNVQLFLTFEQPGNKRSLTRSG